MSAVDRKGGQQTKKREGKGEMKGGFIGMPVGGEFTKKGGGLNEHLVRSGWKLRKGCSGV